MGETNIDKLGLYNLKEAIQKGFAKPLNKCNVTETFREYICEMQIELGENELSVKVSEQR